jgi:hypothetical protein
LTAAHGSSLWSHILRDQLNVSEPEFWNCARDGVKPDRGIPEPPAAALPAELVHLLINRVGVSESEVAAMSKADAVERLNLDRGFMMMRAYGLTPRQREVLALLQAEHYSPRRHTGVPPSPYGGS